MPGFLGEINLISLKNVGPQRARALQKMGLFTVADLLAHYPRRYEDRGQLKQIERLTPGETEMVFGRIIKVEMLKPGKKLTILKAWIQDETGVIPAVWFNQPHLKKVFALGRFISVYGKVEKKYAVLEINAQDFSLEDQEAGEGNGALLPVYATTESISQKLLRKMISSVLADYLKEIPENLPPWLLRKYSLMDKDRALQNIHFPTSPEEQEAARHRLAFEELLALQLQVLSRKAGRGTKGIAHTKDERCGELFQSILPYHLTTAQLRVIREIFHDMEQEEPMARLVQGDVGSGKTVVAAAALFKAVSSGYQGAMMAPTEILAGQHYQSLKTLLGPLGVKVTLLTGGITAKERDEIYRLLQEGEIQVVVGTHALLQEKVAFKNLSLAVTDEQHRFGVRQRRVLNQKGRHPDVLYMSATPIPRTLALTLYGDLTLSVIDQMPPGRKTVETYAVKYELEERVLNFIRKQLREGRQAYIVCPLVEESEKMDLQAAAALYRRFSEKEFAGYQLALLHGKMKAGEKEGIMDDFRSGRIQLLISTTVIEVGVDVPNANLMLVRDGERFGLSQLHQLRGRIGRGEHQSYCIIMHQARSKNSAKRMALMEKCQDGFEIAEADLALRGPGEFFGTRQHGLPALNLADILKDGLLLEKARQAATDMGRHGDGSLV